MSRIKEKDYTEEDLDRIIGMAWEDRTPFEAIQAQFGISEAEVIRLMRSNLLPQSFKRWRKRVQGRSTKHQMLRNMETDRFKSKAQRLISMNLISKR